MNNKAIILGVALSLIGATAHAGPCTDRISALEKSLASVDAGSGPTTATTSTGTPPNPDTPKAGEAPGTGGTAGMNATVGDKATSPADVRAQTSGGATAAQGGASSAQQLSEAMNRARAADRSGDAAACNRALDEAEKMHRG
jgi:hypothetical protein